MADVSVERNQYGLGRYTLDDKSGLWLVGYIDHLRREVSSGRLERGKAHEMFKRELRLFVPESAVR